MFSNLARLTVTALLFTLSVQAHAYYSTMDTGEVTPVDAYKVTLEPQFIFNEIKGFNMIGRFATGIKDDSAVEALVGFGEVDFELGGYYKWIPFPDLEGQPAIGGKIGASYAKVGDDSQFTVRLYPLISKRFETEIGDITPYGSIPIGVTSREPETAVPIQLEAGVEWKTLNFESLRFMAELGFDINDAFSYLSLGLVFNFDEEGLRGSKPVIK